MESVELYEHLNKSLAFDLRSITLVSKTLFTKYEKRKLQILLRDNGICQLCKLEILRFRDFNLDHIKPVSKGGGNSIKNLQATHSKCNSKRGNRDIEDCPPQYFTSKESPYKNKKAKAKVRITPTQFDCVKPLNIDELNTNYCVELYNELARHGMKRLSFNMFKEYFDKYVMVQNSGIVNNTPLRNATA